MSDFTTPRDENTLRLGVHCSIAGGLERALAEAREKKCRAIQVFTRSPRNWAARPLTEEETRRFNEGLDASDIRPLLVHTIYLPNLATSQEGLYRKSIMVLVDDLGRAERIGADFLVIHPGRYSGSTRPAGMRRATAAFNEALSRVENRVTVLIENLAGGPTDICARFEEIRDLLGGIRESGRVGVCLDTAHAHAAGYDVASEDGWGATLEAFNRTVGLDRLRAFHVNDSKVPRGGHVDRHEHIGQGHIGLEGFRVLMTHPATRAAPKILETPKRTPPDADQMNLAALRRLAGN